MIKASDGTELHLHEWPAGSEPPKLVLALVHGYGEHAGRYKHVAERMNTRGVSVFGLDLRGHGRSRGRRGYIERFQDYHLDVAALLEAARSRARGAPVALFGHSLGALIVSDFLIARGGRDLAGVVLSSPFLGIQLAVNPLKEALGRVMSRLIPTLALPSGLKGADVCRDPRLQSEYDADPLNNKNATARWYTETMKAIERVHARAGEISAPLLLLYGGADRVASADATDRFARKLSTTTASYERLTDLYHELVNEPQDVRDKVIDRITGWLVDRASARAA